MTDSTLFMKHDAIIDLIKGMAQVLQNRLRDRALENPVITVLDSTPNPVPRQCEIRYPTGFLRVRRKYCDDLAAPA